MAMDKYDYKFKSKEMLELMKSGAYNRAAEIADTIDWNKVKNTAMLMTVSEIYDKTGDYYRSYDVLNIAYSREKGSRNLIYRLCELAIKTGNVDEAIDFYEEFVTSAPKDSRQYILRYKILKANRGPLDQQIEALVKFKRSEYIEEWAYELARKYQEAGMTAECIAECDDLILWFNEGKYVYKAMELKKQYKPLTPSQQERYDHRYDRIDSATEELPDIEEYEKEKHRMDLKRQMEEIENVEPVKKEEFYSGNSSYNNYVISDTKEQEKAEYVEQEKFTEPERFTEAEPFEEQEEIVEPEEEKPTLDEAVDMSLQKLNEKGIVKQMNLEDALMSLLRPEEYQKNLERKAEEARNAEKEATVAAVGSKFENSVIPEYVKALDEIESVIDINLVNKMVDDANKVPEKFDKDLEELKPVPIGDETEEIISVEEFANLKKEDDDTNKLYTDHKESEEKMEVAEEPEDDKSEESADFEVEESETPVEEVKVEDSSEEDEFKDFEEEDEFEDFEEEDEFEDFEEEDEFEDFEEEDEFEDFEEEDEFEDFEEEDEFEDFEEEDEFEDFEEEDEFEDFEEEDEFEDFEEEDDFEDFEEELPDEEEEVNMKGNEKDITPILPPDIQRLIDEIEGVIPEEPERKPVQEVEDIYEEPHENMGELTEKLRADNMFEDIDENPDLEEEFPNIEEEVTEEFAEEDEFADFEEEDNFPVEEMAKEEVSKEEISDEFAEYVEEEDFSELEDELEDLEETEEDEFADFEEEDNLLSLFEADAEDFDDENFDYEDLRNSLEKEFSPVSSEEDDEREVPDDNDDIPDILSETAPLSRMETAKLHATGKTAPLPTGELADALSMSDTGFVVQGRYDLSAQSGVGTRAGLTDEQKKLFSYFVPVRGMSEQLVDVLEQDKNCSNRQGTSRTGNLLIIGNKGNGKTVLAVDVVKAIQKQRHIHHGKVAIVTGESLNKKKISEIFSKLYGGALIIEKAGKMNEKTVARLNKNMERDTGELLIVLEEQRKPLDRVLSLNKDFRRKFTSRLEVPILINDELVTFGQSYAEENGYRIDEMGILALYSRIDSLQREDHFVTIAEVKDVMDEAIAHNQKGAAKKLVKKVFKKNTDSHNRVILSENDFNA